MVLSDREKYLIHKSILTLMASLGQLPDGSLKLILPKIMNMRCRKLTQAEVTELNDDLLEEFMLSTGLYKDFNNI
jgi:hypothetical protein